MVCSLERAGSLIHVVSVGWAQAEVRLDVPTWARTVVGQGRAGQGRAGVLSVARLLLWPRQCLDALRDCGARTWDWMHLRLDGAPLLLSPQDARKACADATLSQVSTGPRAGRCPSRAAQQGRELGLGASL